MTRNRNMKKCTKKETTRNILKMRNVWRPKPRKSVSPEGLCPKGGCPNSGAPKGGSRKGWGAQRVGEARPRKSEGPKGAGPKSGGPWAGVPKISHFFFSPLPLPFSLFFSLSLWGSSWCLKRRESQMCTFGVLGLSCEKEEKRKRKGGTRE